MDAAAKINAYKVLACLSFLVVGLGSGLFVYIIVTGSFRQLMAGVFVCIVLAIISAILFARAAIIVAEDAEMADGTDPVRPGGSR